MANNVHGQTRVFESGRVPVERRSKQRFEMELNVRYSVLYRQKIIAVGRGKTINLSSSGIAFTTEDELPSGNSSGYLSPGLPCSMTVVRCN